LLLQRIQKLFLLLKKKKKKETKVAPPEDPEVVPPAPRDEPKISSSKRRVVFSSRGSRSSSSCSKYRRRIHKMIQLRDEPKFSPALRDEPKMKIQDEGSRPGMTQDSCAEPQADRVTIANYIKIVADVRPEAKRRFYKNWS